MLFEKMIRATEKITPEILHHPFNQELFAGVLPKEVFQTFLKQDAIYLRQFSNALKLTSQKLPQENHASVLKKFSRDMIQAEEEVIHRYLKSPGFFQPENPIPAVQHYTKFLLNTALQEKPSISTSALLPCFWLYNQLGKSIPISSKNLYQPWIHTYKSPGFTQSTKQMIEIVNELGSAVSKHEEEKMITAFVKSTKFELAFFKEIYRSPAKETKFVPHIIRTSYL